MAGWLETLRMASSWKSEQDGHTYSGRYASGTMSLRLLGPKMWDNSFLRELHSLTGSKSEIAIYQQLRCRPSLLAHHSAQQIANVHLQNYRNPGRTGVDRLEETLNGLHPVRKDTGPLKSCDVPNHHLNAIVGS